MTYTKDWQIDASLPPWVVRQVTDYGTLTDYASMLRRIKHAYAVLLRGRKMRTRQGLFDEFSSALQFPWYFGESWNAFNDCIRDLDWLPSLPIVVCILDASELLLEGDDDELSLLLSILNEAGEEFSLASEFRPSRCFHTILHCLPEHTNNLVARLEILPITIPFVEELNAKA